MRFQISKRRKYKKVTKAVLPAAGFGTRFLPQTKAFPKEMLPIVDKPVIQYVIEELVDAGIKDLIVVTGYHKRAIEDHFDVPNRDLIENLRAGGRKKKSLVTEVEGISEMANFIYLRQKGRYGNGIPLLNVSHLIGPDEPFIYSWCDDMVISQPQEYKQMLAIYEKYRCPCLICIRAKTDDDYKRYGIVEGKVIGDGIIDMSKITEKPGRENAKSDLAAVSAYLLTGKIFKYLENAQENLPPKAELHFYDSLNNMIKDGQRVIAFEIKDSKYYDTGNKLGYLQTVVDFALKHKGVGDAFREYLRNLDLG